MKEKILNYTVLLGSLFLYLILIGVEVNELVKTVYLLYFLMTFIVVLYFNPVLTFEIKNDLNEKDINIKSFLTLLIFTPSFVIFLLFFIPLIKNKEEFEVFLVFILFCSFILLWGIFLCKNNKFKRSSKYLNINKGIFAFVPKFIILVINSFFAYVFEMYKLNVAFILFGFSEIFIMYKFLNYKNYIKD